MAKQASEIRIALPSKGLLAQGSKELLENVGLAIYNPNPRQYQAQIPSLPGVVVIFQRPGDIVVSIRNGNIDFGFTGRDVFLEKRGANGSILELHSALGFGVCSLNVIAPESWQGIDHVRDLKIYQKQMGRPLRVATKFPKLTHSFFADNGDLAIDVIRAEGTLEIAPTVGYADLIVDLVSTGTTLRDNRLKILAGGQVIQSQACLIANLDGLKNNPETLSIATQLLELIGAHLRAKQNLAIFANVRGDSAESIAELVFQNETIGGLQGPTISQLITREKEKWYAIHLIVQANQLHQAIKEVRGIGGSGVVVSPVSYIFEEEPPEIKNLLAALEA
jgi:ATP phosphoribosyltransferase